MGLIPIENRRCVSFTPDSPAYTFFCSAYEDCCENTCCTPPAFKFYSFWYFWLTVILILLLCSGGWWYRFRDHHRFLTAGMAHFVPPPPPPFGQECYHPTAVVYCPSVDRVYLFGQPKAPNCYPPYLEGSLAPPAYSTVNPADSLHCQPDNDLTQFGAVQSRPAPPGFRCLPPSYDSIMGNNAA